MKNVGVIIRSTGEPTEGLCFSILSKQVEREKICVIKGVTPFYNALINSYRQAVKIGQEYTAIVDADIIPSPDAIYRVEQYCEKLCDSKVLCITVRILDHFFVTERSGGIHFYKTSLLNEILQCCDVGELKKVLRPEAFLKQKMLDRGYKILTLNNVLGMHEFLCSKYDIINKNIFKARKFKDKVESSYARRRMMAIFSPSQRIVNQVYLCYSNTEIICDKNDEIVTNVARQLGIDAEKIYTCNRFLIMLLRVGAFQRIYLMYFRVLYKMINRCCI